MRIGIVPLNKRFGLQRAQRATEIQRVAPHVRQKRYPKYRIYMKKAPYLDQILPVPSKEEIKKMTEFRTFEKYLTYTEQLEARPNTDTHHMMPHLGRSLAAYSKLRPVHNQTNNPNYLKDLIDPNIETNFGKSGIIDARRPEHSLEGWKKTMREYERWLEPQKKASFIRNLPPAFSRDRDSIVAMRAGGLLKPELSTEFELVFMSHNGRYLSKHIGVRSESWLNRMSLVPLFGGSRKFWLKLRRLNRLFYLNFASFLALHLYPLVSLTQIAMGSPVSWDVLMPISIPAYLTCYALSMSISGLFYYFQYVNRIVTAIHWEHETRSVCIELYCWLRMFNVAQVYDANMYTDHSVVIKIPQKYLDPELYGPTANKIGYQFDFCHELTCGKSTGYLPNNASRWQDMGMFKDERIHGKCVVLRSLPVNETEIDNIAQLEPFNQLLDHLTEKITPANPEMIPEMDLSEETTRDFYDLENFMYGQERMEQEDLYQNYQKNY